MVPAASFISTFCLFKIFENSDFIVEKFDNLMNLMEKCQAKIEKFEMSILKRLITLEISFGV